MKTRVVLAFLSLACAAAAQAGVLTLSVAPALPESFASASASTCGSTTLTSLVDVVRTEPIVITLTSAPTVGSPAPAPATRKVALVLGPRDCSGFVAIGGSTVFVAIGASLPAFAVIDSFSNATDPSFPATLGLSSIAGTLPVDLFGPYAGGTLVPLVLQAIAEDLPGAPSPWLVSNAVELNVVDPQTAGFGASLTAISSPASCSGGTGPGGPESGGTTITLTGTHFPVHTNWIAHPPAVMVGGAPAMGVTLVSPTTATAVTPAVPPTCPPVTSAGHANVTYQNDTQISQSAQVEISPIKFTYCSGRIPSAASLSLATALPEGGESLVITGADFLHGADVQFTSQGLGNLSTTLSPPDPMIVATGPCSTTASTPCAITVTTPPFCTGQVQVLVVNPDGVAANVTTLVYGPQDPFINPSSVGPTTTVAGLGGQITYPAMTDTGTQLTITGANFLTPSSPLFGAPTVPQAPNLLFPSQTEILDGNESLFATTAGVVAPNLIQTTVSVGDQTGAFRPRLGLKQLRVVNPPCLGVGGAPNPSATVPILIQDADAPTIASVFPDVITPAAVNGLVASFVEIAGTNFFAAMPQGTLPVSETFPTVPPALGTFSVPAVTFGTVFSPEVELVSPTLVRARVPIGVAVGSTLAIKVTNADGRSVTLANAVRIVPRLTNPTALTPNTTPTGGVLLDLDAATLLAITQPDTNPFRANQAILFVPNPTATDDRLEDQASGGDPAVTSDPSAYDACFLFNTRVQPLPMQSPAMRFFDFRSIDVPATITLAAPVNVGNSVLSAGVKRVIFKATSFFVVPTSTSFAVHLFLEQSYPFVLRSHDDFRFAGILDVSGDSLVSHAFATSPSLKFQLRSEWQYPPAAGGVGGRGGLHYDNALDATTGVLMLPQLPGSLSTPSLGTTANQLRGESGEPPRIRPASALTPVTAGRYGFGRAPIGGLAGAGGGGGHALPGATPGQPGATGSYATAGASWGNLSNLSPSTAGLPGLGDAYVYGTTSADWNGPLASATQSFPYALFAGGSGGGGGGGSLAIVVPAVSAGGRGGNGGGAAVLLSDRVFKLGQYGRILADGEKGQLGIDTFPFANGEPLFVLCAPGSGGGGSGGLVFIGAVADADLTAAPMGTSQRVISALGGPGGAPTGPTTVTTAHGGAGGVGRVRIAINFHSGKVGPRQSELQARMANGTVAPDPGVGQVDFYRYPSP